MRIIWLSTRFLKTTSRGYLGLHHRLDQDTSGLLLFARNRALNKDIAQIFADRQVEKTYLAVVKGAWSRGEASWEITDPIASRMTPKGTRHRVEGNGKKAHTSVRLLGEADGFLLLEVKPRTGRTHQIRVHLSHHGLPLWGDGWYDGAPNESGFLLHCAGLAWAARGKLPKGRWRSEPPVQWRELLPAGLLSHLQAFEGETAC